MMFAHPPLGVFKYHQKDLNFICNCVKQLDYKIVFDNPHHAKISKDVHVVESKSLRNFKKFLLASVHKYAGDVMLTRSKFRITNSWVNRSKYASGHPTHFHENSVLSGVFFVQSDETCPPITFESPMNNWQINPRKGDEGRTSTNEFNNFTYRYLPVPGTLLLFSSAIRHHVDPNPSQTERISISFNTFPQTPFGDSMNLSYTE
tara:strand:- start:362 stop:973 length:612 start_codon:yes stop_codon:yes gene_type:complete